MATLFKPQKLLFDPKVSASLLVPAPHHNYAVGGNLVNAFATGPIGAEDDFWLVALEPPAGKVDGIRPLISANLMDAFGRRLLTLDRNRPTFNPRDCRVEESADDLRIIDGRGRDICRVNTRAVQAAECRVSYIHALFKDKAGTVRMETRGPATSPSVVLSGRYALGLREDDTLAINKGLTDLEMARLAAMAHAG